MLSPNRSFSHLYIERDALDYPDTRTIIDRFPKAVQVVIDRFGELLNRPQQAWRLQKESQNIILGVRRDNFIYPMPSIVQTVGETRAFYNTPLINCLYDCAYCYLQGMYSSANTVVFVNAEDFFTAARTEATRWGEIYLSLSYDTDLLGFEGLLPLTARWIEFARAEPRVTIEIRTKSAGFTKIADLAPIRNAILAWTLSPAPIVKAFEHGTASLEGRLKAARAALEAGWRVRLVFDPVLWTPEWRTVYGELLETVTASLPLERVEDATVGVFRMNGEFFKNLKKVRPDAAVRYGALALSAEGVASYPPALEEELRQFMVEKLRTRIARVHV